MAVTLADKLTVVTLDYDKTMEALAGVKTKEEINNDFESTSQFGVEEIRKIHNFLCEKYGGDNTIRDEQVFESLCMQPYQAVFGLECYGSVYEKASKFLEGFVTHQVFVDGNKRTGFASMLMYLEQNGLEFTMSQRDAYDFVLNVIARKYETIEEIAQVVKDNTVRIKAKNVEGLGDYNDMEDIDK